MDQKFDSKNPDKLSPEALIVEIINLYPLEYRAYLLRLLKLFHRAILDEYVFDLKMTFEELKYLKTVSIRIKEARELTENDQDAFKLLELIKEVKKIGLTDKIELKVIKNDRRI